jgi:uncharacterized protein (TIGR00299 family) protein
MRSLHFDAIGGASGDMILGSLVDAGLSVETLKELLGGLNLTEYDITAKKVEKKGFSATKIDVLVNEQPPERHLEEIQKIIHNSTISNSVKSEASLIFKRIAEVEAEIHNKSIEEVHLHELGGTDTIIDVTGTLLALDHLGIERITCSPLPLGSGFVDGAHGKIPLPAPATLALLKGVPVYGTDIKAELITPTAAALITAIASEFGPAPAINIDLVGYGAGKRELPIPNLLRVLIGESETTSNEILDQLIMLETNIDDLSPEIYAYLLEQLFEAGALDVHFCPIHMKKNRLGTNIQVLSSLEKANHLRSIIFHETTTLGIKQYQVDRYSLPRKVLELETVYGSVRVKVAKYGEDKVKASPEFEDCALLAKKHQVPLIEVYREALNTYWEKYQE